MKQQFNNEKPKPPAPPPPVKPWDPSDPTAPIHEPGKYLARKCNPRMRALFFCALIIANDTRSGKLGDLVYSHNTYGQYVRQYTKPTDPKSTAQLAQRAALGSQSQVWRTLSLLIQTAWISLAATVSKTNRMGTSIFWTGQALFNSLNRNLIQAGQAAITAAPIYTVPSAVLTVSGAAAAGANTFTVAFTPTPVTAGVVFQIWASGPVSAGVRSVGGKFKFIANVAAAATSPQSIRTPYTAVFGTLIAGQSIFVQIRAVSITTGVPSPFIQSAVITVVA